MCLTITIEPLDVQHTDATQRLVADPRVTKYTPKPEPYPEGEAAREIERAIADRDAGTAFCFAILADGAFAGVCKLKEVTDEQGELGYWIAVPFWGKGVATRAARLVIEYAFRDLKLTRLIAHTMEENTPSSRVLERLGFSFVRREANTHPKWSGNAMVLQYELTRSSWKIFNSNEE